MSKPIAWCFSLLILTLTACAPLQIVSTPSPLPTPTLDKFGSVVLTPLGCITDLELDEQNVYWSGCSEKSGVGRTPKDGSKTMVLASEQISPHAIAVDEENVFWLNGTRESISTVKKVSKQGGGVLGLIQDDDWITSLAVDEEAVYWTSCATGKQTLTGAVMRMPKTGGTPETLFNRAICPSSIQVDETNLYWIDAGLWTLKKNESVPANIVSDAELRKGVGLRDERSVVRVADIVKVEAGVIYYLVYRDNMPGMIACKDQHTILGRVSKDGTTQAGLGMIDGPAAQHTADKDASYLAGPCTRTNEVVRVFDSGERAAISLEWLREFRPYSKFAADEGYFYWWDDKNNQLRRFPKQSAP